MKIVDEIPQGVRKVDWRKVAETARENPGKWVEVDQTLTAGMVKVIKSGGVRAISPTEFEVTSRVITTGDPQRRFYVRTRS